MEQGVAKVRCPKCFFANTAEVDLCIKCRTPLPRVRVEVPGPPSPADSARPAGDPNITFRPGQVIADRYKILGIIGRGGMGCIYKVHDSILHEDVALKTLLPQFVKDQQIVERFRNEARIARQLSHPNVVRVHDIGFAGPMLYISMEFIRGQSLRAHMDAVQAGQRMPLKAIMRVFDQLCAALEYAHQYTVHRDIKPENIMIAEDGTVRLMDFGISKLMASSNLTATSMVMGTPHYMSPEQLRDSGSVDARADIYSVGVLLYEVLTGKLPVGMAKPASQLYSEVPPALDAIVTKCLDPEPANRFQTASELRAALKPIYDLAMTGSTVTGGKDGSKRIAIRPIAGVALIIAIVLGALGLLAQMRNRATDEETTASEQAAFSREASTVAGVAVGEQIGALSGIVDDARKQASGVVAEDDSWRKGIMDRADAMWSDAQRLAEAGDTAEALRNARFALQSYVGLLVAENTPDMAFVPPDPGLEDAGGGFLIDVHEVSHGAFREFVAQQNWPFRVYGAEYDSYPITGVRVFDALAFAASTGKRVPTETQWLRAALGYFDKTQRYPWGDDWEEGGANVDSTQLTEVTSAGTDVSVTGCLNMLGNAAELTRTPYRAEMSESRLAEASASAYTFTERFVVRGFSFAPANGVSIDLHYRGSVPFGLQEPSNSYVRTDVGFRCVQELPSSFAALAELVHNAGNESVSARADNANLTTVQPGG